MNDVYGSVDGLREACHDIRQPIAAILALAGAALAEAELPENTRNRLEQIMELAEWQSDVVENWLEGARVAWPRRAGDTDVIQVVNEAAAAERLTWGGNLTLVWPPEPVFTRLHPSSCGGWPPTCCQCDPRGPAPHGLVTIEVSRQDRRMALTVEDDGPGFGWLSGSCGLGLPAVARQAARHGGRLECGQGALGGGRVSLWLPLAESQIGGRVADATCPV